MVASRTKESEFDAFYQRMRGRLGHKRALVAAAHLLATRIYEVLSSSVPYQRSGWALPPRNVRRLVRHHTRRLNCLHRWLTVVQS